MFIAPAEAQTINPDFPVVDRSVFETAISGNTLYLAGDFTRVGPSHGSAVPVDVESGVALLGFPKFDGAVHAVVSDGAGGWYFGGEFTRAGDVPRANLAHVLSNRSVGSWNPGANAAVRALALSGGTIYVGGDFWAVAGQNRSRIAAVDASTGVVTSWNPNATGGVVHALAVSGSTIYAGGDFTDIGGQPRNRIAALNASDGLATSWNPSASSTYLPNAPSAVYALVVDGALVYVGGHFTDIGGQTRRHVAALHVSDGLASTWNPSVEAGGIFALAVGVSTVYVGGNFSTIGGQTRHKLAATNKSDGLVTSWNPNPNGTVRAMWLQGPTLYVGGEFTHVGYIPVSFKERRHLAGIDTETGVATDWDPTANRPVHTIAMDGAFLCAGGRFSMLGGQIRNFLAAVDATTGDILPWNPDADHSSDFVWGGVHALAVNGGTVYIGGSFNIIKGQIRNYIAAVDAVTGVPTEWNPNSDQDVFCLALSDGVVYAGGYFTSIGGAARNRIAALDPVTGLATAWDPSADGTVWSLLPGSGVVYAGGFFTSIGGQARARLAALSPTTGMATGWNPGANGDVYALASRGSVVYAAGQFTAIGGKPRNTLAALDGVTGAATFWNPNPNGAVWTITVDEALVYVGGNFTRVRTLPRNFAAALDPWTGEATTWNPAANGGVEAISLHGDRAFLGGQFSGLGGLPLSGIASVSSSAAGGGEPTPGAESMLGPALPNPFGASTSIRFSLVKEEAVTLRVFDVHGREVTVLAEGSYPAGVHVFEWSGTSQDGRLAVSGVYFCELKTGTLSLTRKLILVR